MFNESIDAIGFSLMLRGLRLRRLVLPRTYLSEVFPLGEDFLHAVPAFPVELDMRDMPVFGGYTVDRLGDGPAEVGALSKLTLAEP